MKGILVVFLFSFCAFASFAQVGGMSASDDSVGKLLVYESSKKDPLIPFFLNLFLGFGIGSFAQGDVVGGLSILGFDAIGAGLLAYGVYSVGGMSELNDKKDVGEWPVLAVSLMAVGGATLAITRLVEIVLPFVHASSYNKKLRQNLGVALGGFQPSFSVAVNGSNVPGLGISFTKSY
ncbi:P13 family porin [Borrelia sp. BU AG58]|uniref:P13 family porin n=1 Tax=Borrelia sp. BU AG58 TaxID=2887345 RepID=UPI001E30600D|nr:P13 family porin [Borrelia sp. BU AG58]UER67256.1 P13 family porin [Borrelia sp. BU AG58]